MSENNQISTFLPKFLREISNPLIKNVFLTGCGGGFDFVHSMCLIPELKRLKKNFIIGSYSFGNPDEVEGEIVFNSGTIAKRVTSKSSCSTFYCPEVGICRFLDQEFPENSPHFVYAYYARDFSVPILTKLYQQFIDTHEIDAVLIFDGGSDSLMKGNEAGVGDPIEDAVSVATVAFLNDPRILFKSLICVGLGADRYNDVSDCSSLRAISEITDMNGFLGSISIEKASEPYEFYKKSLEFIYKTQSFRSVLSGSILASAQGYFGSEIVPELMGNRVQRGSLFVWPLMAVVWAFDPVVVAQRSWTVQWIKQCESSRECNRVFNHKREELESIREILPIEELPRHVDYSARYYGIFS